MIMHPAVIALNLGSLLVSGMLVYVAFFGIRILRRWDIKSGSELQLTLERKTYLISTVMVYAFSFQFLSLFLFIYTADKLSALFIGAMCAAGTLNVHSLGYPSLFLKVINALLAGIWLIINVVDNKVPDYPLIKVKYRFLLFIAPMVLAETFIQGTYFLHMKPHIITSCCGSLFTEDAGTITAGIAGLPVIPMEIAFYVSTVLTMVSGFLFLRTGGMQAGAIFSGSSVVTFLVSVAALISFISLYFYELPTHHCPFCILKREYYYAGYALYLTLLGGAIAGMGVGALMPFRRAESLKEVLPRVQKELTRVALAMHAAFAFIATCVIMFSNFRLDR